MKSEFRCFCSYHLGDQILAVYFLNVVSKFNPETEFLFWTPPAYEPELQLLIADRPNLKVVTHPQPVAHSIDLWIGQDGWYSHRRNADHFVDFLVEFFSHIAKTNGLVFPSITKLDFLLPSSKMTRHTAFNDEMYDVLFVNSSPLSSQCHQFCQSRLDATLSNVAKKFKTVATHPNKFVPDTISAGLTLANVGELASRCQIIVGIANAPFLVTFNEKSIGQVKKWVNYACDRVNFDNDRVVWANSIQQFESLINSL